MVPPSLRTFSLFILAFLLSCGGPKAVEKIECADRDPKTGMPITARQTFQSGLVNYRVVSFTFSPLIQAGVVAETRCAVPLDEQGHGVFYEYHPQHRAFVFNGNYASQRRMSNQQSGAELHLSRTIGRRTLLYPCHFSDQDGVPGRNIGKSERG